MFPVAYPDNSIPDKLFLFLLWEELDYNKENSKNYLIFDGSRLPGGVQQNSCSRALLKIVKKYLWASSILVKLQAFGLHLYQS